MSKQYILIGASASSFGALHSIRRLDPLARVIIISAEVEMPYNKCLLADYCAGAIDENAISIYPKAFENVQLITGQKVIAIDDRNKTVTTDAQIVYPYDKLFLGMGSSPYIPEIPGSNAKGIFTFHTNSDVNQILQYIKSTTVKRAVVIGAGLSGLEAADALVRQNITVTIIERNNQVLPSMLCVQSSNFLHNQIRKHGVELILNATVTQFLSTNDRVCGVEISNGKIDAEMILIATGLKPNIQLCTNSQIQTDTHGVMVNEHLQTNFSDIYAGGDLIGVYDQISKKKVRSCLWPDAMQQGMHAGMAMAGFPKPYHGAHLITSTAFFGIKYARAGNIGRNNQVHKIDADYHHTFEIQNGILTGFQVLGNQHNLGALRRLLLTKEPVQIEQL